MTVITAELLTSSPDVLLAPKGFQYPALLEISQNPDPNAQLHALSTWASEHTCNRYEQPSPEQAIIYAQEAQELADFAADPDSSPSTVVRIYALERALAAGYGQQIAQFRGYTPEHQLEIDISYPNDDNMMDGNSRSRDWRYGLGVLMEHDDIDYDFLWPDAFSQGFEPESYQDYNPGKALIFLDRVVSMHNSGNATAEQADYTEKFLPLITEIQAVMQQGSRLPQIDRLQPMNGWRAIKLLSEYATFGEENHNKIIDFLNSDNPNKNVYYPVISSLYLNATRMTRAFPAEYSKGALQGFKHLLADSAYAVMHHLENNGHTDVKLPLNDQPDKLPLHLDGDEPLALLKLLSDACTQIESAFGIYHTQRQVDGKATTIPVVNGDGYALYRLMGSHRNNVTAYIRPRGSHRYNKSLEYGRNGEGVEASISFVVDVGGGGIFSKLVEVGKHSKRVSDTDNRISIRLDREGVAPELRGKPGVKRNPMQENGTLSLDVGSVIGDDEWLSTKLGRFLAFGNYLRSQAEGKPTHLNHSTEYFDADAGNADIFAARAEALIRKFESARMSKAMLAKYLQGYVDSVNYLSGVTDRSK